MGSTESPRLTNHMLKGSYASNDLYPCRTSRLSGLVPAIGCTKGDPYKQPKSVPESSDHSNTSLLPRASTSSDRDLICLRQRTYSSLDSRAPSPKLVFKWLRKGGLEIVVSAFGCAPDIALYTPKVFPKYSAKAVPLDDTQNKAQSAGIQICVFSYAIAYFAVFFFTRMAST